MSAGLPYLRALRKPELVEIAEQVDFSNPEDYNKNDLVVVLDRYLRNNQNVFAGLESLSGFYNRLASPRKPGPSPTKRDVVKTPARRMSKKEPEPKEEQSETEDVIPRHIVASPAVETPTTLRASARQSRQTPRVARVASISAVEDAEPALPASPAVVTEVIDNQTRKLRQGVERAWQSLGFIERAHSLRDSLSSLKAIETMVLLLEGGSLLKARVPIRYLTTIPAIRYTNTPALRLKVPDLFQILEGNFWLPISLWFFVCFFLPLVASYFINLSAGSRGRNTRSKSSLAQFDPLIFNIAKALLVHLVFSQEIHFGLTTTYNIRKVRTAVLGGEQGMLTGTAIGAVGALYEAILNRA